MIATSTPDSGFPLVFATNANTSFSLDKATAGSCVLVLIARRANDEVRLPLAWQTIVRLIGFIENCRESLAGRLLTENNFLLLAENGRFEIRLGRRSIAMSRADAYCLADALSTYRNQDRDTSKNRT